MKLHELSSYSKDKKSPSILKESYYIFYLIACTPLFNQTNESTEVFQQLRHQVKKFESTLTLHYPAPILKVISYLLCLCIDASIIDTLQWPLGKRQRLLHTIHQDSQGEKRLLAVLETLLNTENVSKEILIIGYLCTMLGSIENYLQRDDDKVRYLKQLFYQKIQSQLSYPFKKSDNMKTVKSPTFSPGIRWTMLFVLGLISYYSALTFTLYRYSTLILST